MKEQHSIAISDERGGPDTETWGLEGDEYVTVFRVRKRGTARLAEPRPGALRRW